MKPARNPPSQARLPVKRADKWQPPSPERDAKICARYKEDGSYSSAGREFGLSPARISQIVQKAGLVKVDPNYVPKSRPRRQRSGEVISAPAPKPKAEIVLVERIPQRFNWFSVRSKSGSTDELFNERVGRELGSMTKGYFLAMRDGVGWVFHARVFDQKW